MCAYSMIVDHRTQKWGDLLQQWPQGPLTRPAITAEEIKEFRELLDRAREYDKRMHQPDCETDSKRAALKKIADELGVDISFV